MNIYHWGPILNPSFPKLDMVENIAFQGNISTLVSFLCFSFFAVF